MKHEHSSNMLIGAVVVLMGLSIYSLMNPSEEKVVVEVVPTTIVEEAVPFDFVCWSGKTEMIRFEGLVEAQRYPRGGWRVVKKDSPEMFYTPRGGELCGVIVE